MTRYQLLLLAILPFFLQSCAGPGKPGEAPTTQPSPTPKMDYIYHSPPTSEIH